MSKRPRVLAVFLFLLFILLAIYSSCKSRVYTFEEISPQEAGFSPEKLEKARKYFDQIGSAALLALYDGKVFISWGNVDNKYWCHSIRKAFLNSLYDIYVDRGLIDLNKTLKELNIDDIPPVLTEEEKQARVVDLIRSRSGVYHPAAAEASIMIETRPKRGSHAPGTFFYYNNWDFNVLGTIFEKETGTKIFEAFEKEIARPLGMRDFDVEDCIYQDEKEKSIHPAYHFRMSARDMGLFGLLYQRNGFWKGKQIIPQEWIAVSTKAHSIMDQEVGIGYGYLWYVIPEEFGLGLAFFHTGAGVHMLLVLPDLKIVLVHRVDTDQQYTVTSDNVSQLVNLLLAARIED